MQDQLNELVNASNKQASLDMQKEILNKQIALKANNQQGWTGLQSIINDKQAQDDIISNLSAQEAKLN
jgi:hypothetical protein